MGEEQKQNFKAMEADLKRMLNMNQDSGAEVSKTQKRSDDASTVKPKGVVFTKDDVKERKGSHKKKGTHHHTHKHHQPAAHRPRHQEDPTADPGVDVEDENHMAKKKKKSRKKKIVREIQEKQTEGSDSDNSDTENWKYKPEALLLDLIKIKYLDDKLTPSLLHELQSERIFPLKKKSTKFPHAKYYCRLCDYHCDNIPVSRQHANDARHRRRKEIRIQDKMLKTLPRPSSRHIEALDELVETIYAQHGLSDDDLKYRHTLAQQVQDFITGSLPDVKLSIIGSSLTGLGMKGADVNMDLVLPAGANPATNLIAVYKLLAASDQFQDVKSNFLDKVPSVLFKSSCKKLECRICVGNDYASLTGRYLNIYRKLDVRCRKLAVMFKYWARICELDKQASGSLPAYTYSLMTIFFLQQCQPPVLPALWTDLSEKVLKRPKLRSDEEQMLTQLELVPWASKNQQTCGTLWRDLILFYGVRFDLAEYVICMRSEKLVARTEKKWRSKRVAIEDPFFSKRNVGRSMHNTLVFDYFYNCLRKACLYFSLPTSHQKISLYREESSKFSDRKGKDGTHHRHGKHTGDVHTKITATKITESVIVSQRKEAHISQKGESESIDLTVLENVSVTVHLESSENKETHIDKIVESMKSESCKLKDSTASVVESSQVCESSDKDSLLTGKQVAKEVSAEIKQEPACSSQDESSDASIKQHAFLDIVKGLDSDSEEELQGDQERTVRILESKISKMSLQEDRSVTVEHLQNAEERSLNSDCDSRVNVDVSEHKVYETTADTRKPTAVTVDNESVVLPNRCDKSETENDHSCHKILTKDEASKVANVELGDLAQQNVEAKIAVDDLDNVKAKTKESTIECNESTQASSGESKTVVKATVEDSDTTSPNADEPIAIVKAMMDSTVLKSLVDKDAKSKSVPGQSPAMVSKPATVGDKGSAGPEAEKAGGSTSESTEDSDNEVESPGASPLTRRRKQAASPTGAEYNFEFTSEILTDGKGPSIYCAICEKEGHLKMDCPEDKMPEIVKLAPVTTFHLDLLTPVVKQVPRDFQLTHQEIKDRESVRKNIELHIQDSFPDAELCLFGSSRNGFGFHQSDLDICVTFKGKNAEDVNFVEYIEELCKKLKLHRGLYAVFPITSAKVPIVKFKHRNSQLEGDISLYNILAMENTRLLYTYACIDQRVQTLGYAIKVFAKVCDIGDASKGSLSSYAYMLMMLHYLQQTKPPVIPVLQEVHTPDMVDRVNMVEGCNAWFFDNLLLLPKVWPDYKKNTQSVGELWLGFFRYYLEEFSVREHVVNIRRSQTLTKFEKLWNSSCIAIEDPFDLGHNLGGGLSRRMNQYIVRTFVHARELYGTSIERQPKGYHSIQDFFFDKRLLVDGDPPSDRLCRVCSKIGHIAKECPRVQAKKEREANEKRRRDEQRKRHDEQSSDSPNRVHMHHRQDASKERVGNARSLSEPGNNHGLSHSPADRGPSQFYQQHSNMHQSPDKIRPLLSIPMQGKLQSASIPSSPGSPHRDSAYPPNWNSPGQSEQGYFGRHGSNNQSNHRGRRDQNENSASGRWYQNQYRNQKRNNSQAPAYSMNQNYDHRQGDMGVSNQQREYTDYPTSPVNGGQSGFFNSRDRHYNGPQHGNSRERRVNAPKGQDRSQLVDLGITVKNENKN